MADVTIPTQQFVEIKEIKDGIVYLKDGGLRKLLIVSGVNFDLKSEEEQTLILNGFQNFINTLEYTVQLFIHSRKVNIDGYLQKMGERKDEEENELLKIQIEEYISFIRSLVEENAIINKTFFAIVPYDGIVTNSNPMSTFTSFFGSSNKAEQQADARAKIEQLNHRIAEVRSGLEQIGLRVSELEDEELTELFYNLYNPQLVEKKDLVIAKEEK